MTGRWQHIPSTLGLLLCLLVTIPVTGSAQTIHVAVASNFAGPMKQIAAGFEKKTGHQVRLSFGSSGKFFAQIKNRAPFHVFLSADQDKPERLEQDGLTLPDSRLTYATGQLVLWTSTDGLQVEGPEALRSKRVRRVAMANPRLAPYGRAAQQSLSQLIEPESLAATIVYGENISQTFQFVLTGNAQLGFIAASQLNLLPDHRAGSAWFIPADLYTPIHQDAVAIRQPEGAGASMALLGYLASAEARNIIKAYGYKVAAAHAPVRK